ncbi:capsule biosynthesis protein [Nitrosomonadaceae bacterium]|nr:capsule biosynthesis protein [Nitrosomonadaceae bacterium]
MTKIQEIKLKLPITGASWHPQWDKLIQADLDLWQRFATAQNGPRVLIANSLPCFPNSVMLESLLGATLTLRGAQVHTLICDAVLPACLNLKYSRARGPESVRDGIWKQHKSSCARCTTNTPVFTKLGLPLHYYSQYLPQSEVEVLAAFADSIPFTEISHYRRDGLAIGEHASAGCLRYFASGNLEREADSEIVLRRYFLAALFTARIMENLLDKYTYDVAVFHHGIYIPQGIVGEVCRARGVRVVNWNPAYRKRCFIFSHGDTYHHTLLEEPVEVWKNMQFDPKQEQEINDYLRSRWSGSQDWIWFHDTPDARDETLVKETGLDLSKPVIGLLTNVMWDAQLHYRANAFPNMLDWLVKTIRYFEKRPDIQLLIRIHPAELRGALTSRQQVQDEIRRYFPTLPTNIFIIQPESNIDTYTAMLKCNAVIIYGTKTGVELTSMGIPVIVAGEAWIRNKGLTLDVSSEQNYYRILDTLPLANPRLPANQVREARKYAYHFFLRRMIPLNSIEPVDDKVPFRVKVGSLAELLPGTDKGMDIICNGILHGAPFIYPHEEIH